MRSTTRSSSARDQFERVRRQVVDGPGQLDRRVRHAAFTGGAVPDSAVAYVEKVRQHAYTVTDADINEMKASGWTEEAIFELTVATALGFALRRLDTAHKAMTTGLSR
jgi:alkylhydroperoxidase family enzyme